MNTNINNCPCSGKNMSNLAGPWILLILYHQQGTYGYEINKIFKAHLDEFPMSVNITGLYRHLNTLEKRGMLSSQWDTDTKGPAKRRYYLTEAGMECLWRWMNTLGHQALLLGRFFDQAREAFPNAKLPNIKI